MNVFGAAQGRYVKNQQNRKPSRKVAVTFGATDSGLYNIKRVHWSFGGVAQRIPRRARDPILEIYQAFVADLFCLLCGTREDEVMGQGHAGILLGPDGAGGRSNVRWTGPSGRQPEPALRTGPRARPPDCPPGPLFAFPRTARTNLRRKLSPV